MPAVAPSAYMYAGSTTPQHEGQHHLTASPLALGGLGSMDPMQWSIWSARASYPPHVTTPADPPNPLVQSTLLLHRVKHQIIILWLLYNNYELNYSILYLIAP